MASKPRLLDLGCGAGGISAGYAQAGFDIVGVDIVAQKNYPFEFHLGDMLTYPLEGFDVIHASPTCQRHAKVTKWRGDPNVHPDTLTPILARLRAQSTPWVVENVPEALPEWDLILCGSMFGLSVKRHRGFLIPGVSVPVPNCQSHSGLLPFIHKGERAYANAMGCDWMSNREGRQAIPPAYSRFIGEHLISHLAFTRGT